MSLLIDMGFSTRAIADRVGHESIDITMDMACVELKFTDGSMISIDTIAVENEVANNMYKRSELDYLIYNDLAEYADLILNEDPEVYLKAVTEYKPLD